MHVDKVCISPFASVNASTSVEIKLSALFSKQCSMSSLAQCKVLCVVDTLSFLSFQIVLIKRDFVFIVVVGFFPV